MAPQSIHQPQPTLTMTDRESLIQAHEQMRGKMWADMRGFEFVGIQEFPGHESLVLYNLPSGTTKSATWSTVNAELRTL